MIHSLSVISLFELIFCLLVGWLVLFDLGVCWFEQIHFLTLLCIDWHVLAMMFVIVVQYLFSGSFDLPSSMLLICCMALGISRSPFMLSYLICIVAFLKWFGLLYTSLAHPAGLVSSWVHVSMYGIYFV